MKPTPNSLTAAAHEVAKRAPQTPDLSRSGESWEELYHSALTAETNERTRRTWRLGATLDLLDSIDM